MVRRFTTLLAAIVLLTASGTSLAAVTGSPDITASLSDSTVVPGETTTFDVALTNTGSLETASSRNPGFNSEVTTARGLRVDVKDGGGPFTITTDERVYGSLPQGTTDPISFSVVVDEDAEPGTYRVPVVLAYEYTEFVSETSGDRDEATERTREMVTVTVAERATFDVVDVDSTARVDSTGTVTVAVENTGTETAHDATVGFASGDAGLTVGGQQASSRYVSEWDPGTVRTFQYRVGATPAAEADTYEFGLTVDFDDTDGVSRQSVRQSVGVVVAEEQSFSVTDTRTDVAVGDSGAYSVTLRNEGPVVVDDATVQVAARSSDVSFGGSESTTQYVGAWEPGETRTVTVEATTADGAEQRPYALTTQVGYEDQDGDTAQSDTLSVGLRPQPEQSFRLDAVNGTVRAGEDGRVQATLTNTGDRSVENLVVTWQSDHRNLSPQETQYAVGDLAAGESATVTFGVDVSDSADAGPRQFDFVASYRDADGDRHESDTLEGTMRVDGATDAFAVSVDNGTVSAGDSSHISVTLTNTGGERVTDVSAKLFADSPISVADDEAYVASLAPGASTTLTFSVSASGGALEKTYPLALDFRYEEPDGDTPVSDTYRAPVQVVSESGGGGVPLTAVGGLVVVGVLAVGGYSRFQ